MPSHDDVYRKFGEASEAAQLLETELGSILFQAGATEANLFTEPSPECATALMKSINRHTLGQLLAKLRSSTETVDHLQPLLSGALAQRNRLSHSYFRQHNYRINSEDGRAIMMEDLESIHQTVFVAYKAVMRLSGIDLDNISLPSLPTGHLPI